MATTAKEMDAIDLTELEMDTVVSSSFTEAIKSLLENGTLSDVSLRAGSQLFPAHMCILSARSPVFKAMFNGNFKEKMRKCVEIYDVDENTVKKLLSYIYTDQVGELQWQGAADLYRAADKYQLLHLKRRCATILKFNLSISNVCAILVDADMHHDRKLRKAAEDFIIRQGEDFFKSDTWRNFKEDNPKLAWEIVEPILCNKNSRVESNKSAARIAQIHDMFPHEMTDNIAKILQFYDDDENKDLEALTSDEVREALSNRADSSGSKSKNREKSKGLLGNIQKQALPECKQQ